MRLWLLIPLMLGCRARGDDLVEIPVQSARLVDTTLTTAAIVAGVVGGSAVLEITDTAGVPHEFPVTLDGSVLGGVIDVGATIDFGGSVALDLSEAAGDVSGNDLLGMYSGSSTSMVVGLGVDGHALRNRSDVQIDKAWLAVGISIFAGVEWLAIHLEDPEP